MQLSRHLVDSSLPLHNGLSVTNRGRRLPRGYCRDRDRTYDLPNDRALSDIKQLIDLRRELHQYPELSNNETKTAERVASFLERTRPDQILRGIGGEGVAAVYESGNTGLSVMIRCELDALPIQEINQSHHRSAADGVAHQCGHDGHMAIVAGVGMALVGSRPKGGRVILLFQPAEETGEGAARVLEDPKFKEIEPDLVYALHNLPGYQRGGILVRDGIIASASKGLIIHLKGAPSHAAHPDNGVNPALAASQILQGLLTLPAMGTPFGSSALITPIHISVGKPAFGTSADEGVVMVTLRSHRNSVMEKLGTAAVALARSIGASYGVKVETEWTEEFQAVRNHTGCVQAIREVADRSAYPLLPVDAPFSWSEDFGRFTDHYQGALFGIGAGENHPQLHNNHYDFPDELISQGVRIFTGLIEYHCGALSRV